jgi:E3 ubiquitin-protein ligase TRIP12
LVIEFYLNKSVKTQINALKEGFSSVVHLSSFKYLFPEEFSTLISGVTEEWTVSLVLDAIKADHGFTKDSPIIHYLAQVMSELTPEQKRAFTMFVTGSPNLPIGGLKGLNPPLTVVCKASSENVHLPSVMTCVSLLG